jgi:prevent-host-death family protein
MRQATITQAKNGLSALIDRVRAGESVVILDRGKPVAVLQPAASADDPDGRLARLARAGLVRLGTGAPPIDLISRDGPPVGPGSSVVDALLAERRTGR